MKKWLFLVTFFLSAGIVCAEVIYSNDFDEVAGTVAKDTVPDSSISSYYSASTVNLITDGSGSLYCSSLGYNENYRFRLDPTLPLNQNPTLSGVKCTVRMRVPDTSEWIGIGYHGVNMNGLLSSGINSGPWFQVGKSYVVVRGGHSTSGTAQTFSGVFTGGTTNTLEFTYYFDNTVDLVINGTTVTNGMPVEHINEGETDPVDPVIGWFQMQFRQQESIANGGPFIDDLTIETLDYEPTITGNVIYEDDFSGPAGTSAKDSVPEVSPVGFLVKDYQTGLSGDGLLYETNNVSTAGFRVRLGTDPLTDDSSIGAVKLTAWMRIPTNDWIALGFSQYDYNGMLGTLTDSGPWLQVNPSSISVRGGNSTDGSEAKFLNPYSAGETAVIEFTYNIGAETGDLVIDGVTVSTNIAMAHEYPAGTTNSPTIYWFNSHFRFQPAAADGGGYVDRLRIETFDVENTYEAWAQYYGLDAGQSGRSSDPDGDGMDNLLEYALGSNPGAVDASAVLPSAVFQNDELIYVYKRRLDAAARGLSYGVILRENLVSGSWTNIGTTAETGSAAVNSDFETVTNSIPATNQLGFASLRVEEN